MPWLIGSAALVALVLPCDAAVGAWLSNATDHPLLRRLFTLPNHLFRWPLLAALLFLLLTQPLRTRRLAGFGIALGSCLAAVHLLKFVLGRARPDTAVAALHGPYYFGWFGDPQSGFDSFPSGHAAWTVLLVLLVRLYLPRAYSYLIVPAVLACLSRVVLERHFLSDVVAGAGLAVCAVHCARILVGADAFAPFTSVAWSRLDRVFSSGGRPAARVRAEST